MELNFESTINRAKYECVLVTNGTTIPNLASCKNLLLCSCPLQLSKYFNEMFVGGGLPSQLPDRI